MKNNLSIKDFLDYEVKSNWLASWIGFSWGQELLGRYFAWKTLRKYHRYTLSKQREFKIKHRP
jgi:hypothetical protein